MMFPVLIPEDPPIDNQFPVETPLITSLHSDISAINTRLENLTIESNTQSLRIEVERVKRQKLHLSLRQVKQNMLLPCPDIASLKYNVEAMQGNQNAINYQLEGEITNMNVMTFRRLSRMHQIITFLLPMLCCPQIITSN